MWSESYPITLVVSKDSWYENFAINLEKKLKKEYGNCQLVFNHEDITQNSIVFYLSYQRIVPIEYLKRSFQSLVTHASDLPKGKGFSPWVWQILEGCDVLPMCLFEVVEALDAGPIIMRKSTHLLGTELLDDIRLKLADTIEDLVLNYLSSDKKPEGIEQKGVSSFYRRRTSMDSELDINKSIKDQFNLLRTVDNNHYPAFFNHLGKRYILKIESTNE